MLECQKRAIYKYREKNRNIKDLNYMKRIICPICSKEYLNTNKTHHENTKYHKSFLQ